MTDRIKFKVTVNNPNYFLKDLLRKKIELFSINQKENDLELIVSKEDFEHIKKMKTIKKLKIIDYYGKSKIKFFIKRNYIFILLGVIGIILNFFLSNLIFKVEINTPNQELKTMIQKDLEEFGIKKYQWKVSFQKKNEIKEKLKAKEKDRIEWLEIDEKGTKYIIEVEEKKKKEETTCTERNIIAKKDAILTKIESSSGEILKKKEDYVEKGEVIISGLIHNKETIVSKKCAEGIVYGEVWYKVTVEVPTIIEKEKKTKESTFGVKIQFQEKKWIFPKKYEVYEINEYNIVESKITPIKVSIIKEYKKEKVKEKYSEEELEKIAMREAIKQLEDKLGMKDNVIRKNVLKKTAKNSKIIIEVFFAIEEDITSYQDISQLDIEKMNQETEE